MVARHFGGLLVGTLCLWQSAWAVEAFTISDVRVEGLQRISAGTVFNALPVKVGDQMDDSRTADTIRALFRTGFFKDVRLERDGDVLVVFVNERPAVAKIDIDGNKSIETENLLAALKDSGFAEGRVFNRSVLEQVQQELTRQYFAQGQYAVKVNTDVTPLERNRVGVTLNITEGQVARIRQINLVGNEAFDDEELLKSFQLSTPTLLSFYTRNDRYSKQKLAADLETLRSYYLDRGYINFRIDSTQVSITPDRKDIYITINVTEGDEYTISSVKLAGDLVVQPELLFPLVQAKQGTIFSRKATTRTSESISDRLGQAGYAFANVNTIPEINDEDRTVDLTFFVDPGRRVYVRRINISGNTKTRDEVVRREVRQMEGGWVSTEKVQRSRDRIDRLGYFTEVNVNTPAVPGTADQVDVDFTVEEKPSGNLLAGIGFSQSQGIVLSASLTQENFFGSGKRVGISFNNSDVNTRYGLSYNNPYHTIDGVSRGFDLFYRETDADEANVSDYTIDNFGFNVTYGVPINEFNRINLGLGYEFVDIGTNSNTPREVSNFLRRNGNGYNLFKMNLSYVEDSRNSSLFPTRGDVLRFSAEIAVPGSDLEYFKTDYRYTTYKPVSDTFTFSLSGELGSGAAFDDGEGFPFFENFFAGGGRSVRGFEDNTLGPRDSSGDPFGGSIKLVGSAEVLFPFPLAPDTRTVRMSTFFDAGNVFDGDDFDIGDLRYSAGVGARWLSPLGALTFSLAFPLNDESQDDVQVFQFSFGSNF